MRVVQGLSARRDKRVAEAPRGLEMAPLGVLGKPSRWLHSERRSRRGARPQGKGDEHLKVESLHSEERAEKNPCAQLEANTSGVVHEKIAD